MIEILNILNAEIEVCESNLKLAEMKLSELPEGRLRISLKKGKSEFYHCVNDHAGTYIKEGNRVLCEQLANREKYEEIRLRCQEFLKFAYPLREQLENNNWRDYPNALHHKKREFFDKDLVSDEESVKLWLEDDVPVPCDERHTIRTEKGDYVRSKSEKDIADMLYNMDIPYKYEYPLNVDGNMRLPDFTIYDKRSRKEVYWEHFGILDDENYAKQTLYKIDEYYSLGYHLYDDLIISCETKAFQFPFEFLRKYLKKRFC